METVSIATTQNINIDYKLAGLMERIYAFLLDSIIILAFFFFMILLTTLSSGQVEYVFIIIGSIIAYLYFLLSEVFLEGQTVGKRVANIRVVKLDGTKPTLSAYLLRWVMFPLDMSVSGAIAITLIIFTKNAQRLGDLLAGTTVIKDEKKEVNLNQMKGMFERLDQDYEPTFPEAINITTAEIRLIEDAIHAFRHHGQIKPAEVLKDKMQGRLNITTDMPSVKLLRTLAEDYHYYASR